jgi:hypothetical protein
MPFPNLEGKHAGRPWAGPAADRGPGGGHRGRGAVGAGGAVYGPSWTTDAPYRETAEEVAKYRAEGMWTLFEAAEGLLSG